MITEPPVNTPFCPLAPRDLYFSQDHEAWIVSRHRDVLAALRSPDLSQARPPAAGADPAVTAAPRKSCFAAANGWTHSDVFSAFLNARAAECQRKINQLASALLQPLIRDRPVDLVAEFIRPWCLASAVALIGVDPVCTEALARLVKDLSESDAAPQDVQIRSRAKQANRELDRYFVPPIASHGKSMFLGMAQTVPYFLASAWAALLQYPSEWGILRTHLGSIPRATEELLRYAGPVHSIFRQAETSISIGGTRIAAGDRLVLRLASANRDPRQFTRPDRLDVRRATAGHLALSSGSHYCVGAHIVRMMTAIATETLLATYAAPELRNGISWSGGTMLAWPSCLPVLLGGAGERDSTYSTTTRVPLLSSLDKVRIR